jgi:hypothetical protein
VAQAVVRSTRLRNLEKARPLVITSDGMAPTLRPRRDVAMIQPVDSYIGEGVYAVMAATGSLELFRVGSALNGRLSLRRDNPVYGAAECTAAEFAEAVLGKMTGRLEFYDREAYASFVDALQADCTA